MSSRHRQTRSRSTPSRELSADDGLEMGEFADRSCFSKSTHRKAFQLCAQVQDTVSLMLADGRDEVLTDLYVISVRPAPDTSQLLVLVGQLSDEFPLNHDQVIDSLQRAEGRLRAEVAASITRRRTPRLVFAFLPKSFSAEDAT